VIESPDWAAILCVTADRQIAIVRQYRHGVGKDSFELPAGALETGEEPLAAAQRELREETGYASERWLPVLTAAVDPARQSGRAHFFCALDAEPVAAPSLDASEDLETLLVSRAELLELVDTGRLVHGLHIAAILTAERRGLF
jgi:8-oxo-dGTP pyrophosphatase MutT (NUDIX family)